MTPELNFDGWTEEQKYALIDRIWESMPEHQMPPIPEWHRAILAQRLAEAERNPGVGSTWEEVLARLNAKQ